MKGNGSKIKRTPSNIIFNLIAYSTSFWFLQFSVSFRWFDCSGSFTQNSVLIREGYRILAVCVRWLPIRSCSNIRQAF